MVNKDFAVAHMAGVEGLACRFDDGFHRHLAHHDLHLYLRQKFGVVQLDTAVVGIASLLQSVAKHLRDGHTGHTDGVHGVLQLREAFLTAEDGKLGERCICGGGLDGGRRCCRSALMTLQENGGGVLGLAGQHLRRHRQEVGIGADKIVLRDVQAADFLLTAGAQADGFLDDSKHNRHGNGNPGDNGNYTEQLRAEELEAAAIEQAPRGCRCRR